MWMAGGGVRGGQSIGATDSALLGVDHGKHTYVHKGRLERATLNEGDVPKRLLRG
jgi:hypothetical protein